MPQGGSHEDVKRREFSAESVGLDMKTSILYAIKKDGKLCHFHPSKNYVYYARSYAECDGKIYKLDVTETSEDKRTHYAFWDYEREKFGFIHELISGVIANFPYGFDEDNRSNKRGIILPVKITERS